MDECRSDSDPEVPDCDLKYMKESHVSARWRVFFLLTICLLGLAVIVASITCHVHCFRPVKKRIELNANGKLVYVPPAPKTVDPDCTPGTGSKKRKTCSTDSGGTTKTASRGGKGRRG
ncbi:uncharacterized protein [Amphiura filiformis]|uniref:uncharacterized protein n=1 Tax=Amphiura filiformis TaxID=82378 RepID=UPI003B20CADD